MSPKSRKDVVPGISDDLMSADKRVKHYESSSPRWRGEANRIRVEHQRRLTIDSGAAAACPQNYPSSRHRHSRGERVAFARWSGEERLGLRRGHSNELHRVDVVLATEIIGGRYLQTQRHYGPRAGGGRHRLSCSHRTVQAIERHPQVGFSHDVPMLREEAPGVQRTNDSVGGAIGA